MSTRIAARHRPIMLLLLTGARRNEVSHAKWDYVDWERRTLLVPISKTGRPRVIALNGRAMALLRAIPSLTTIPSSSRRRSQDGPARPCIFHGPASRSAPVLTGVRLHDLRHSFASFLVNEGVSLYVVQGLLGHTQPRTTQRYAHLAQHTLNNAAEVVAQVIGGATSQRHASAPMEFGAAQGQLSQADPRGRLLVCVPVLTSIALCVR